MRPHLWLVRVFGRLVPRHLRSEWQQEWEAELHYREIRDRERADGRRAHLVRPALSAFWDALWLRAHAMQTLRMLAKHWRLTLVATLSLAAALAVTVAGFGAFNALMLRPPGVESPDRLLSIFVSPSSELFGSLSFAEFMHYRAQNHVFSDVAALPLMIHTGALTTADVRETISSSYISDNGFDVLGVRPALGQLAFASGSRDTGSIIFSHALWARLGSDPAIVGTIVRLDRHPLRVIGVTPATFTGMQFLFEPDAWLPLREAVSSVDALEDRTNRWLSLIGRLKPGVTPEQARADVRGLSDQLAAAYPATDAGRRAVLVPTTITPANTRADITPISGLLLVVVLTALAAGCANVTNLLISLAFIRRQELQIRSALGASRRQLVAQLLRESLILATGAGAIGYGLATFALDWLSNLKVSLGVGFPRMSLDFHPDATVVWFTIAIVMAVGVSTGLWPAIRAASDAQSSILDRDAAGGARRSRARSVLVIVQMAAATVVLIGVGWSVRSLANLLHVQPGFTARQLAVVDMDLATNGYKPHDGERLADALRLRLRSMPGVEAVTVADGLPLGETGWGRDRVRLESASSAASADEIEYSVIDGDFFAALGIGLVEGRTFDARDTDKRPETVIVNATMARRFWPGGRAVGQRLRIENGNRLVEVIGVAADGKYTDLDEPAMPFFYFARSQHSLTASLDIIVRVAGDATPWKATVARVVREIDPALEFRTFTLDDQIKFALFLPLVTLMAVGGFASLALVLAIVGLYGTVFHSVSQRRHEIGIRMAMGALPRDVFRLVVGRTLWLACAGALAGVSISLALLPLVSELFFGVRAVEPLVVGSVVAVTLAIAATTAYAATRPWSRAGAMELLRSS